MQKQRMGCLAAATVDHFPAGPHAPAPRPRSRLCSSHVSGACQSSREVHQWLQACAPQLPTLIFIQHPPALRSKQPLLDACIHKRRSQRTGGQSGPHIGILHGSELGLGTPGHLDGGGMLQHTE